MQPNLTQAIQHVIATYNYTLLKEGSNFAQFMTPEGKEHEMMYDYARRVYFVYSETGKAIAPTQNEIFTFIIN